MSNNRLNRREFLAAAPAIAAAPATAPAPRIWDPHCHILQADGRTPGERLAYLLKYADRMGIERIVIHMGYPIHVNPTPEQFRYENDQVLEALTHHHNRAFGWVYLNPNYVDESLKEFDRCVRDGPMVGVKLWVGALANQKELDPIVERAAAFKAPILQHTWFKVTGNSRGESNPSELAALARRHPTVPIICGHTGGDWELGIRAIRGCPNLYADLAGFDPAGGCTEMAVRELGAERVLYGSDIGGPRSLASQLGKVMGANISDGAKRLILGENMRNMMLPILKAKGVRA
jgi:hypothetical protein